MASNIVPGIWAKMMKEECKEVNASIQDLCDWLFHEPNPIPLNTAMAMLGMCKPIFRGPYVPCSKEMRERGVELLTPFMEDIPLKKGLVAMEDKEFTVINRC